MVKQIKKLFMCMVLVLTTFAVITDGYADCSPRKLPQTAITGSDEYLWVENNGSWEAYECGGDYCSADEVIVFGYQGYYLFKGQTITSEDIVHLYSCQPGVDDMWVRMHSDDVQDCDNCSIYSNLRNDECRLPWYDKHGDKVNKKSDICKCCGEKAKIDNCKRLQKNCEETPNTEFMLDCDNFNLNDDDWASTACKCLVDGSYQMYGTWCPQPTESGAAQDDNVHVGDACPADKLPLYATAGVYIKNGDKFVCAATACRDGTHMVKNERGESQGWCRAGAAPVQPVTTPESPVPVTPDAAQNNGDPVAGSENPQGGKTQVVQPDVAQPDVAQPPVIQNPCEQGLPGFAMYNGACITKAEYENIQRAELERRQNNLSREIENIADELSDLDDSFKRSRWKNEDGKFNTARLASDSIAGVVLGTVGGVVTSNVIKKNNLKKGFENIKCVIGGQDVADWGDQFNVGIR